MTLSGRTVIVTGGNRGIGFDVCRKLAHAGNNVILCSRSLEAGSWVSMPRDTRSEINAFQSLIEPFWVDQCLLRDYLPALFVHGGSTTSYPQCQPLCLSLVHIGVTKTIMKL